MTETIPLAEAGRQWFYANQGVRSGPVDETTLLALAQNGTIRHDTLVWSAGMAQWAPAPQVPLFAASMVIAPPTLPGPLGPSGGSETDATGGLIPYRNGAALAGYYCGVFSLIPFVGAVLGPIAFVLGIVGLRAVRREPRVRGTAHATVALVLGGLTGLLHWGGLVAVLVSR